MAVALERLVSEQTQAAVETVSVSDWNVSSVQSMTVVGVAVAAVIAYIAMNMVPTTMNITLMTAEGHISE